MQPLPNNLRALLVDDYKSVRQSIAGDLTKLGLEVTEAVNGFDALLQPVHVVLGLEVLHLRANVLLLQTRLTIVDVLGKLQGGLEFLSLFPQ